ncbi:hypothetical protein [Sebaldella sp. S0638]|uniref:hypothetical protein n=1 Tax=Sebaldella sp. S0638 TaxID=2957809 RepID=UPI00209E220B|nr:hypothetical protein [Sebaldella sp. S0638]MCP1225524.1 hypothetical protein [Sebaldella sp. S0638]
MYSEKSINRIENIDWESLDFQSKNGDYRFIDEYLRRLANFIKEKKIENKNAVCFNIAKELGYDKEVDLSKYLNDTILEKLDKILLVKYIITYYVQLSKLADKNSEVTQYLNIYEPLIRLLEKGTVFLYKERGIMIPNVSLHPLGGWYERYLYVEPIDIDKL